MVHSGKTSNTKIVEQMLEAGKCGIYLFRTCETIFLCFRIIHYRITTKDACLHAISISSSQTSAISCSTSGRLSPNPPFLMTKPVRMKRPRLPKNVMSRKTDQVTSDPLKVSPALFAHCRSSCSA